MSQLTGITKPQSPFRRVDIPTPQQQQQQQQQSLQRKQSSGPPQHFRPQPPVEQSFVPSSTTNWSSSQNPSTDLNARPGIGSMNK